MCANLTHIYFISLKDLIEMNSPILTRLPFLYGSLVALSLSCSNENSDLKHNPSQLTQASMLLELNSTNVKTENKVYARFEQGELESPEFSDLISAVSDRTNTPFEPKNFKKTDDVFLLTSHYQRYIQMISGSEVEGASVRVWRSLKTKKLILAEAFLASEFTPPSMLGDALVKSPYFRFLDFKSPNSDFSEVLKVVNQDLISNLKKKDVRSIITKNMYSTNDTIKGFIRRVEIKEKYRTVTYDFANWSNDLLRKTVRDLPSGDHKSSTYSLPANAYPLWEIVSSTNPPDQLATPTRVVLPNLMTTVPDINIGSYLSSKKLSFLYSMYKDGHLSLKDYLKGFWNQDLIAFLFPDSWDNHAPVRSNMINDYSKVRLFGKNALIVIHQNAPKIFKDTPPDLDRSPQFSPNYTLIEGADKKDDYKVTFSPLFWGIPVVKEEDLLNRVPAAEGQKPKPEDTPELLRSGFDEAQVYYATDLFLSTFQNLGFRDPELSTKPFVAILFDPDLEGKDNAFYSDNTINFMTYSANAMNYARDNSTIWHELGHGLQDRLMGPHVDSSEGYGLWEGMADFLAQIIIAERFGKKDFQLRDSLRILNNTYFYLTNESHDEGESYGGAMNVMLESLMDRYGDREGILRMTDLTLETMRLTRDHPRLTAEVWFEQMKYVDTLSRDVPTINRKSGELLDIINQSLARRNYSPSKAPAKFEISFKDQILTDRDVGSRASPLVIDPKGPQIQSFSLGLTLFDGEVTKFNFPVTIRIAYRGGALQGAMKWIGEEDGPLDIVIDSPNSKVAAQLQVDTTACDFINRNDGGCQDYAYLQIYNAGDLAKGQPIGKKRFYLSTK
jgi:hypothetical protein